MSDTLSFTEISGQHVELLPARTVMSVFATGADGGTATNQGTTDSKPSADGNPFTFLFSFAGKLLPMK